MQNYKSIYYPPGGILLWIIIYLELITFGMAMVAFIYYGQQEKDIFVSGAASLNKTFGVVNTILLLSSGYFVAKAVQKHKARNAKSAIKSLNFSILFGFGFLLVKTLEYYLKTEAGHGLSTDTFYMFYWLLTGFHWIHVFVGICILFVIKRGIARKSESYELEDLEAGAAFWHMCDLIWLILFPALYLCF